MGVTSRRKWKARGIKPSVRFFFVFVFLSSADKAPSNSQWREPDSAEGLSSLLGVLNFLKENVGCWVPAWKSLLF